MTEEQAQYMAELVHDMLPPGLQALVEARYSMLLRSSYVVVHVPGQFLVELREVHALSTIVDVFGRVGAAR